MTAKKDNLDTQVCNDNPYDQYELLKALFRLYGSEQALSDHAETPIFDWIMTKQRKQWLLSLWRINQHLSRIQEEEYLLYDVLDWVQFLEDVFHLEDLQDAEEEPQSHLIRNRIRQQILQDCLLSIKSIFLPLSPSKSSSSSSSQQQSSVPLSVASKQPVLLARILGLCCNLLRHYRKRCPFQDDNNNNNKSTRMICLHLFTLFLTSHPKEVSLHTSSTLLSLILCQYEYLEYHDQSTELFDEIDMEITSYLPWLTMSSPRLLSAMTTNPDEKHSSSSFIQNFDIQTWIQIPFRILLAYRAIYQKKKLVYEQGVEKVRDKDTYDEQTKIRLVVNQLIVQDAEDEKKKDKQAEITESEQQILDELKPYFHLLEQSGKAWNWDSYRQDLLKNRDRIFPLDLIDRKLHQSIPVSSSLSSSSSSSTHITTLTPTKQLPGGVPFIYCLPM